MLEPSPQSALPLLHPISPSKIHLSGVLRKKERIQKSANSYRNFALVATFGSHHNTRDPYRVWIVGPQPTKLSSSNY